MSQERTIFEWLAANRDKFHTTVEVAEGVGIPANIVSHYLSAMVTSRKWTKREYRAAALKYIRGSRPKPNAPLVSQPPQAITGASKYITNGPKVESSDEQLFKEFQEFQAYKTWRQSL